MRTILMAAAIAACSGGITEPAHEIVTCEIGTATSCERACAQANERDDAMPICIGAMNGSATLSCETNLVEIYEGVRGCCVQRNFRRLWFECPEEP